MIVVLAGGVGAARFLQGVVQLVPQQQLTVIANTGDDRDKVLAYYRKSLSRYGDVIECRDNQPVGSPEKTSEGLTCSESHALGRGLFSTARPR